VSARLILWPAFFGLVLVAWVALWAMGQEMRGYAVYGAEFWAALCRAGAADLGLGPLAAMWGVMVAAMMLPTFVPALATFRSLPPPAGRLPEAAALVAGYLAVWAAAALGFAVLQRALAMQGLLAPDGASLSDPLTAGLLALTGLYQLTRLKSLFVSRCRMPMTYFVERWRPGIAAGLALGLRFGRDCLGCCWALMLVAFVGGMSNLLFMGLATVVMVLEKLPEIGRPLTRPLGYTLLAAAAAVLVRWGGGS
jgi:predicted metal-binding membrane protein